MEIDQPGNPMSLTANADAMGSKRRFRLDLLGVALTSRDPKMQAAATKYLPQGTITFVYDSGTLMLWSDRKRVYYVSKGGLQAPRTRPTPAKSPSPAPASPFGGILTLTRSVTQYEMFSQSVNLVGHRPVNGHMSTVFHFEQHSKKRGETPLQMTGDIAFADDMSGIPVRLWTNMKYIFDGSFKLDLTDVSTTPPDARVFSVPRGYRKVGSFVDVLRNGP